MNLERPLNKRTLTRIYRELLPEPKVPKATDASLRKRPLIEVVDMRDESVGGDIVPRTEMVGDYTLSQPFVRVSRLIVLHTWAGTTLNYDNFGDGGGSIQSTLQSGFQIFIDDKPLFPTPITSTKGYMRYAFDTDVVVDTLGVTKKTYFTSRLSFHKLMGNLEGIDLTQYDIRVEVDIAFPLVSDGVQDFGDVFTWAFEGWGWDR